MVSITATPTFVGLPRGALMVFVVGKVKSTSRVVSIKTAVMVDVLTRSAALLAMKISTSMSSYSKYRPEHLPKRSGV